MTAGSGIHKVWQVWSSRQLFKHVMRCPSILLFMDLNVKRDFWFYLSSPCKIKLSNRIKVCFIHITLSAELTIHLIACRLILFACMKLNAGNTDRICKYFLKEQRAAYAAARPMFWNYFESIPQDHSSENRKELQENRTWQIDKWQSLSCHLTTNGWVYWQTSNMTFSMIPSSLTQVSAKWERNWSNAALEKSNQPDAVKGKFQLDNNLLQPITTTW